MATDITPAQLEMFIQQANARYMVALLILLGMVCVAFGATAMAFGCRRIGFFFLGCYGALMSFLGVGLCYIFGPIVVVAALGGMIREWFVSPAKPAVVVPRATIPT